MTTYINKLISYNNLNNNKFNKYLNKIDQKGGYYNKQIKDSPLEHPKNFYLTCFHGNISNNDFILDDKTYLLIPFCDGCINAFPSIIKIFNT